MSNRMLVNKMSRGMAGRWVIVLFAGMLVGLGLIGAPGVAQAAGILVQSSATPPASPVVVVPWTTGVQATFGLQATDTDPAPTETLPGEPPQNCQGSNPAWSWIAQVTSGPTGPMAGMNPPSGSTASQLSVSGFTGPGSWQVQVTATVSYQMTPCPGTIQRSGSCTVQVYVVGIDHLQFQLPGGSFQNMPSQGLYVATGTTVTFQAVVTPTGAP